MQHTTGPVDRATRYAPTVVTGDDGLQRGINLGVDVAVTRNGEHYAAGVVVGLGATDFVLLDETGRETTVPHDPGPGIAQVARVDYRAHDGVRPTA
jgi:hypothetical protein